MSTDRVLDRIRAANPVAATAVTDPDLLAQIVGQPGDPRLLRSRARRRRLRGLAVVVAAIVFSATGGAFGLGVFSHATPKALFEGNPAAAFPGDGSQTVDPRTVHRATTFTVPGVGRFEYWVALSTKGWLCNAIRQPDGTWADLGTPGDKYQLGGPVPGCGKFFWHDARGFAYYPTGTRSWRIVYGYAPTTGQPVEIRDAVSGATAPIGDGRYFAIVLPQHRPGFRLQTLDAARRVLVTDQFDPGM
jgi:hypothetical protein